MAKLGEPFFGFLGSCMPKRVLLRSFTFTRCPFLGHSASCSACCCCLICFWLRQFKWSLCKCAWSCCLVAFLVVVLAARVSCLEYSPSSSLRLLPGGCVILTPYYRCTGLAFATPTHTRTPPWTVFYYMPKFWAYKCSPCRLVTPWRSLHRLRQSWSNLCLFLHQPLLFLHPSFWLPPPPCMSMSLHKPCQEGSVSPHSLSLSPPPTSGECLPCR